MEREFPRLIQLIEQLESSGEYFARWDAGLIIIRDPYRADAEYDRKWDERFQLEQAFKTQITHLKTLFKTADLRDPRTIERRVLYDFIREYYRDHFVEPRSPEFYQLIDGEYQKIPIDYDAIIELCISQMKGFRDQVALSEGIELISNLLYYRASKNRYKEYWTARKSDGLFEEFRLDLAEMAAKIGDRRTAYRLVFRAYNRQGDCGGDGEYINIRQIFFEETPFAKALQARREATGWGNPSIIIISGRPHLKSLYFADPLKFYKAWNDKDKLQALFDTMRVISFPLDAREKELFDSLRTLARSVFKSALDFWDYEGRFFLAEFLIGCGQERRGFEAYRLICQYIENFLRNGPFFPYREYYDHYYSDEYSHWKVYEELDDKLAKLLHVESEVLRPLFGILDDVNLSGMRQKLIPDKVIVIRNFFLENIPLLKENILKLPTRKLIEKILRDIIKY
ncbi:MAG: hypothetical protein ACTSRL_03035 [Candidatus Helarchaeota archaeon]